MNFRGGESDRNTIAQLVNGVKCSLGKQKKQENELERFLGYYSFSLIKSRWLEKESDLSSRFPINRLWSNFDEITERSKTHLTPVHRKSFALSQVSRHRACNALPWSSVYNIQEACRVASLPLDEKRICPKKETPFSVARPLYKVLLVFCCRFYSLDRPATPGKQSFTEHGYTNTRPTRIFLSASPGRSLDKRSAGRDCFFQMEIVKRYEGFSWKLVAQRVALASRKKVQRPAKKKSHSVNLLLRVSRLIQLRIFLYYGT